MNNCKVVKIQTPKKYLLNGLFFGQQNAKNVFIFVHGLGGSLFSQVELIESLVNKDTAVISFNNRGSGIVNKVRKIDNSSAKGYKSQNIGSAHEVFTDCVDDIEGAVNFALANKPRKIFLVGHSTGCQKSVYYLSKRAKSKVSGAILLAPMSDFASMFAFTELKKYNKQIQVAKKMKSKGRGNEFMPRAICDMEIDAQRFLSLFDADSAEEIFSYASDKNPKTLKSVNKPLLIVLAEKDEFRDRQMTQIADWFFENLVDKKAQIAMIKEANHIFKGCDDILNFCIKQWMDKAE